MHNDSNTTQQPALRRALKARHLTMIAIGGSIGTGLFVASGATIAQAGPGGALLSYILIGLMVYFLMTSLGELAVRAGLHRRGVAGHAAHRLEQLLARRDLARVDPVLVKWRDAFREAAGQAALGRHGQQRMGRFA